MSAYATLDELAQVATDGWDELAQFASSNPAVTGALLRAHYLAPSPDTDPDLAQDMDSALAKLAALLESVSRYADSYLHQRYRELVPLSPEHYLNTGLPFAVAAIALGRLYGLRQDEEMRKTLAAQEAYLRDLAKGHAGLNYQAPSTPEPDGRMRIKTKPSAFSWGKY